MGCGCGSEKIPTGTPDVVRGPSSAPQPSNHVAGQYGTSILTRMRHMGAPANPATAQAGVVTSPDSLDGVTAAMRGSVVRSNILAFVPPIKPLDRGTMRLAGAVIVQATNPVPVVSVMGYPGELPFDSQPMLNKPKPWIADNGQ